MIADKPKHPNASSNSADHANTSSDVNGLLPIREKQSSAPKRGFWFMRDIPVIFWMTLTIIATILHRFLPEPRWLMMHLLFLGVITHVILIFSQHFSFALTRTPQTLHTRRAQNIRLILANIATVTIVSGVLIPENTVAISGAVLLIMVVFWHGVDLTIRVRKALPSRFGHTIRYYIISALALTVGASFGIWMLSSSASNFDGRVTVAHAITNVLGFVGLTVAGTTVTLWPTMLRTQIDSKATFWAKVALPLLGAGVLLAAIAASLAQPIPLLVGILFYLAGLIGIGISLFKAARKRPPRTFATLSVAFAMLWWILTTTLFAVHVFITIISNSSFITIKATFDTLTPFWAAGFMVQIVLGALSYLIPVLIAGGPSPVRIGTATFDIGGFWRIGLANLTLFLCLFPLPSLTLVVITILYLIAVAAFVPLMILAIKRQSQAKRDEVRLNDPNRRGPIRPEGELYRGQAAGRVMASLVIVVFGIAVTSALVPEQLGPVTPLFSSNDSASEESTAPIQRVQVAAADMRFTPSTIEVPSGTRLIIELTNTDSSQVHDLFFENGVGGSRLSPGASETIDVGIITEDLEGWCSIIGHRQMGMTLDVIVTGESGAAGSNSNNDDSADNGQDSSHNHHSSEDGVGAAAFIDLMKEPAADFVARDATLQPLPKRSHSATHEIDLVVTEQVMEVAPGVTQKLWTFGQSAPGPTLHGKVGDRFVVTLTNDGSMGHSIDFHAGALAPDEPMRTIAPGESLTYTFTANRAGIWMYHCATMPMTAHIANGMYGAVIIEPEDLPEVDHNFIMIQSEYYLGDQGGEISMDKLAAERPDLVTFNGYANQYTYRPLAINTEDRVRVWVLNVGPNRNSSFHVIGGQFDTVYAEGNYLLNRSEDSGSQALGLFPAQAGFVELTFPEAGNYPFVSHVMIDAERGASGIFHVTDK